MIENNCYKCKWRGTVPGDAHSCCKHPDLKGTGADVFAGIMAMVENVNQTSSNFEKFKIRANPHGIEKGWFFWPINFDPIWLENCNAFEIK